MTGLRKSILFMLIHLTILFNMERFDFGQQNVIDIQTFVYLLAILAILVTLFFKALQHISVYASVVGWAIVYVLLKLFFSHDRPILGDIYTYITVTELSLLTITIFLAHDLSRTLHNFEEVVEKVTLPRLGQRILPLKEAAEDIKTEFIRSRRHNRPLAVMVVNMEVDHSEITLQRTVKEIQKAMLTRYLSSSLAQVLSKIVRRTDMILAQEGENGFVLLCPETNTEGLYILADRLQTTAADDLGVKVKCGFAAFPDEALTFDELLSKARINTVGPEDLPVYTYPSSYEKAEKEKVK
jgi:GGDEF domain-containing protein